MMAYVSSLDSPALASMKGLHGGACRAPSRLDNSISSSSSELTMAAVVAHKMALKTAIEQVEALQYKLQMFGVLVEGSANVFCDSKVVYKNTSISKLTLKKKCHSIVDH
jgi:hypothetical protein